MKTSFLLVTLTLLLTPLLFDQESRGYSTLAEFTAYGQSDHVKLTWSTQSRDKIAQYVLERSRNGKDFSPIKTIESQGDNPSSMEYFEIDTKPLLGWSFYRIKLISKNDEMEYTHPSPVFIGLDRMRKGDAIEIESPVTGQPFSLEQFSNTELVLVLRAADGQEYYTKSIVTVQSNKIFIAASDKIPANLYTISSCSKDELIGLDIVAR